MNTVATPTSAQTEQPVTQAQLAWTQQLMADTIKALISYIELRDDEGAKHRAADLLESLLRHAERFGFAAVRPEPTPSIDW